MVANPTWDPNGPWVNVLDDGDPWTTIPPHWQQGWFTAAGISQPVNQGSPLNNAANISISGGVLNMKVANIGGTNYGCLMTTNPANVTGAPGFTLTPPYAVEAQLFLPGPVGSVLVPNWIAWWTNGQNWPVDGEGDVVESLGANPAPAQGDWNSGHVHDSVTEAPNGKAEGFTSNCSPAPSGLHTFGYYRTATQIFFYYDGKLVSTQPINTTAPHYLVLTHTYNGSPDILPSTLGVHWVRAWTPGQAPTTGMQVTATASGSQTAAGLALSVRVLNGAKATQAGATAHNEALTTPALTATPVSPGSVMYGAITNGSPQKFTARDAATTFFQNLGDAITNEGYLLFRGTNPTPGGPPAPLTLGASGPGPGGQMLGVLAEIQAAAGQVIAEDPSSPPGVFVNALVATTQGFTPPGGSLLVAIVSANYNNANTPTVAMAVTDSSGLTWTQLIGNSGPGGQDLCSVWIAGTGASPITGPPATSRQLIVSIAPESGTDPDGNPFPQGVQVGAASGAQIALRPSPGAAEIQFPVPAPMLSNIANIAGGSIPNLAELLFSGPALAAAGNMDWVQVAIFSNDGAGSAAHMEFRAIDTTGVVTVTAQWNGSKWYFQELVVFAAPGIRAEDPANPGSFEPFHSLGAFPVGTTTRGQYRLSAQGQLELDINLTGTPTSGTRNFPNTLPAAYRPSVTKRIPAVQGAGTGWVTITTAGVVSCTIAAGGSATFDCAGVVELS